MPSYAQRRILPTLARFVPKKKSIDWEVKSVPCLFSINKMLTFYPVGSIEWQHMSDARTSVELALSVPTNKEASAYFRRAQRSVLLAFGFVWEKQV